MKIFKIISILFVFTVVQFLLSGCYTVIGETVKEEDDVTWDSYYNQDYQSRSNSLGKQQAVKEYDTVYVDSDEDYSGNYDQTPFVQNINIYNTPATWDPFYDDFDWHFSFYLGVYSGYFVTPVWDWWYWRHAGLVVWEPWWWDYYYYYDPYRWAYGGYYWYNYPIYTNRPGRVINIARRNWNKRRPVQRDDDDSFHRTRERRFISNDPVPVRSGSRSVGQGGSVDIRKDPTTRTRTVRTLDPTVRDGNRDKGSTIVKERTTKRKIKRVIRRSVRSKDQRSTVREKSRKIIRESKSSVRRNNRINSATQPKPVYRPRRAVKPKIHKPASRRSGSVTTPHIRRAIPKVKSTSTGSIKPSGRSSSTNTSRNHSTRSRRSRTR